MRSVGMILTGFMLVTAISCTAQEKEKGKMSKEERDYSVQKSEEQWRSELTPEQYYVLRNKGTERPFTGKYNMHFEDGMYSCAACGAPLFTSESKFESHCGWPSFDRAANDSTIREIPDYSHGMVRTEIVCANCGGHLGHVFEDGPTETGLRYCINSVSIDFEPKEVEPEKEQ